MTLKITEKKESPLLSRTEVKARVEYNAATPSREQIKKQLASLLKANENLLAVKKIKQAFGLRSATISAYLYSNEQIMAKLERKKKSEKPKKLKPKEEKSKPEAKEMKQKETESEKTTAEEPKK